MEQWFQGREIPVGNFKVEFGSILLDQDYIDNRIRLMKINPGSSSSNDYYEKLMEVRARLTKKEQ